MPRDVAATAQDDGQAERADEGRVAVALADTELDALMERLRAELAARDAHGKSSAKSTIANDEGVKQPHAGRRLGVDEILALPDEEFIATAYRMILRRNPDPEGRGYIERRLEIGLISRLDVLVELRRSTEGREKHADVPGLGRQVLLAGLRRANPVRMARSTVRLLRNVPRLALYMRSVVARVEEAERRARTAEAAALRTAQQLERAHGKLLELDTKTAELAERVARIERGAHERIGTGG